MAVREWPLEIIPEYSKLIELEAKQAELAEILSSDEFAAPEVKAGYELALEFTGQAATELSKTAGLQLAVATIGEQALQGLSQLKPIQEILPEQQIAPLRESLQERLSKALDFFEKYGAHTEESKQLLDIIAATGGTAVSNFVETTAVEAELSSPAAQPETEESTQHIRLIVGHKAVRVNRRGQIVPFSSKHTERQADYTAERREALIFIANNQDKEVSPYEIWEAIYDDGRPFNLKVMAQVRSWLLGLSHRRRPVIETNGKRGVASRYRVSTGFSLSLETLPEVGIAQASALTKTTQAKAQEKISDAEIAGIKLSDLYLLGLKLESLNEVLKGHGKSTVPTEALNGLEAYRPNLSELCDEERLEYRQKASLRVQAVFEDDDKLMSLIESAKDEHTVAFIDFLWDFMAEPEDRQLMSRLIRSKWQRDVTYFRGLPETVNKVLVDQFDNIIWPIPTDKDWQFTLPKPVKAEEPISDYSGDELPEPESEPDQTAKPQSEQTMALDEPASEEPEQAVVGEASKSQEGEKEAGQVDRRHNHTRRDQINRLEAKVKDILDLFVASFEPTQTYKRQQIQVVFKVFTSTTVKDARENNVGPRSDKAGFTIRDVIDILLYDNHDLANILKIKQNQKIVDRVITKAIRRAERKHDSGAYRY